jgi:hypothetical protein
MSLRLLLLFTLSLLSTSLLSARHEKRAGRALFFTQPNFRGECLVIEGDVEIDDLPRMKDSRGRRWDDCIASVKIEGPVVAIMYEHPHFKGERVDIQREVPDLGRLRHGETGLENWDRRVSSLRVETVYVSSIQMFRFQKDADRAIKAAFRDLLGREPDFSGLQHYRVLLLERGWDDEDLRDDLRKSREFHDRDVDGIVRRCFREILGRDPDPKGLRDYVKKMRDWRWTEADLRQDLHRSREAADRLHREIIMRAFKDLLGREPDSSGFDHYLGKMRSGWNEQAVRDDLRRSDEFRRRKGGR